MAKKNYYEHLYAISKEFGVLKQKRKDIQNQCPHKKPNGKIMIKHIGGDDSYDFRCRMCGEKIDLGILEGKLGAPIEKIKKWRKGLNSAINAIKLQANPKRDEKLISNLGAFKSTLHKSTKTMIKLFKGFERDMDGRRGKGKKGKRYKNNVVMGGRSML